jgi:hypothetical protein
MANLKSGTLLGGNLIWHQGNLEFQTVDTRLDYKGHKVYTEAHKPTTQEINAVNRSGDTMTGKLKMTEGSGIEWTPLTDGNLARGVVYKNRIGSNLGFAGAQWTGNATELSNYFFGQYVTGSPWSDSEAWMSIKKDGEVYIDGNRAYHAGFKPTWADVGGNLYWDNSTAGYIKAKSNLIFDHTITTLIKPFNSSTKLINLGDAASQWKEVWSNSYRGGNIDITSNAYLRGVTLSNTYNALDNSRLISFSADKILRIGNSADTETHTRIHGTGADGLKLSVWQDDADKWVYHEGHKPTPSELGVQPSLTTPFSTRMYYVSHTITEELLGADGNSLKNDSSYLVRLVTQSTGTSTGAVYNITVNSTGVIALTLIAHKNDGSNHPELSIIDDKVRVKTKHDNKYNVSVLMQEVTSGSPNNMWIDNVEYFSRFHKPDVTEVTNAVSKLGDTMTGALTVPSISTNRFDKNDTSGTLISSTNTPVGSSIYINWRGGNNILEFKRGHSTTDNTSEVTAHGKLFASKGLEVVATEQNAVRLTNTNRAVNTIASGVEADWYDNKLLFGHKRDTSSGSVGFAASLDGTELFNARPDGTGYLKTNRIYTTGYKPSWEDIGGDSYWADGANNSQTKNSRIWIVSGGDSASNGGILPARAATGSSAWSVIGRNDYWFNESWVNSYRGGSINVDGRLTLNNSGPTINLKDTDNKGAFLHTNSNVFYVLRSSGNNSDSWDNGSNGRHPLMLDLNTGDATVSRGVKAYYAESNALASQYGTLAPFYNDYSTAQTSAYFPAWKQKGIHTVGAEDWVTSMGQSVNASGVAETTLHMIKHDGTSRAWSFKTNGEFRSGGSIYENGHRVYSSGNKPTASDVGLSNVPNTAHTSAATANTVAVRDAAADINVRLLRSNYANETRCTGAMAFRVNNTTDNYTRYCSDTGAIRTWLGTYSKTEADGRFLGKTATATRANDIVGHYISGGSEKPNYFGGGKLRCHMLNSAAGIPSLSWSDVVWVSGYTGSDVKLSNALIFSKSGAARAGFRQQNYDSTTWGTFNEFYHTGNKPTAADVGAPTVTNGTVTRLTAIGTGNDYSTGGVMLNGNGSPNTVFPTLGFHQPGKYAASLQCRSGGKLSVYTQGGTVLGEMNAKRFTGESMNLTSAAFMQSFATSGTGGSTMNGSLDVKLSLAARGITNYYGDYRVERPSTTGGWARGLTFTNGSTTLGGVGILGSGTTGQYIALGMGSNWWDTNSSMRISANDVTFQKPVINSLNQYMRGDGRKHIVWQNAAGTATSGYIYNDPNGDMSMNRGEQGGSTMSLQSNCLYVTGNGGGQGAFSADNVHGGSWVSWQTRPSALLLTPALNGMNHSAFSIWKVTTWGQSNWASQGVHAVDGHFNNTESILYVGNNQYTWGGRGFRTKGVIIESAKVTDVHPLFLTKTATTALDIVCGITSNKIVRSDAMHEDTNPRISIKPKSVKQFLPEAYHEFYDTTESNLKKRSLTKTEGVDLGAIVAMQLEAIKELKSANDALLARVEALEAA